MLNGFMNTFMIFQLLIVGIFTFIIIKAFKQWNYNNKAPIKNVNARLIKKYSEFNQTQMPVAGDITGAHGFAISTTETFYGLFETEDGEELRFILNGRIYHNCQEGQTGTLSFKGTRFISFQ